MCVAVPTSRGYIADQRPEERNLIAAVAPPTDNPRESRSNAVIRRTISCFGESLPSGKGGDLSMELLCGGLELGDLLEGVGMHLLQRRELRAHRDELSLQSLNVDRADDR